MTSPPKAVEPLLVVENVIEPVLVPVEPTEMTVPGAPPLLEKSRLTEPMRTATG